MNEELLEAAKKAINEYHGDTSVSQQTTLEGLEELRDDINAMIEAINNKIMERDRLIQNRINQIDTLEKELSTLRGTYSVLHSCPHCAKQESVPELTIHKHLEKENSTLKATVEQASRALEDALRREAVANKVIELLVVAGHVPGERVGQARQLAEKL